MRWPARRLLIPAAAALVSVACAEPDDDARFVPAGLTVTALAGGTGVLELRALTLREGALGVELYAAVENVGDVAACSAALAVELYDASDQPVAAGVGGLVTQQLYRLTDGSGLLAACVCPGDVSMSRVSDLPQDLRIDDVKSVVYRSPYFALDAVPIDGLRVESAQRVTRSEGTAYTGTLVNELEVAVRNPSVTVFPVNRVGRPLGAATAVGTEELAPGGEWEFETSAVAEAGVDYAVYPAGAVAE